MKHRVIGILIAVSTLTWGAYAAAAGAGGMGGDEGLGGQAGAGGIGTGGFATGGAGTAGAGTGGDATGGSSAGGGGFGAGGTGGTGGTGGQGGGDPDVDADGDGYSVNEGDCDDTDDSIYPGAPEIREDGIDSNCNGDSDESENYNDSGIAPVANGVAAGLLVLWIGLGTWRRRRKLQP